MKTSKVKAVIAALVLLPPVAQAQDFPSKTVKFVVPFPAGGPADTIGRVFTEKLAARLGHPVVIENRSGAGGVSGVAAVAKSAPDGYTMGIASSGALAMNVALKETMPYDPFKDLILLTQAVSVPELLVVAPSVQAQTFQELIALAKSQPGKMNYASTGIGGAPHMAAELLKYSAKVDIVHVPYAGAAPAVNDMLGGHVQMMFADIPALLGSVQSGKLRALAIGSKNRSPTLPDVKTTAELGLPDVEADNWYGLVLPVGTPKPIADKLFAESVAALKDAEVKDKLSKQGIIPIGSSTVEFLDYVKREIDRWGKLAQAANIKLK